MAMTTMLNTDAVLLVGRLLVSALFIQSGVSKPLAWNAALDEIASFGMPRSTLLLAPAIAAQLIGGLGVAAGLFTIPCALVLLAFMVPATFYIHGFWRYSGEARKHHFNGLFQNLTVSGGLALLLITGPGAWSIDAMMSGTGRAP
ncbi:MAG: DoxX family protein [Phycisphaerales bacterium]